MTVGGDFCIAVFDDSDSNFSMRLIAGINRDLSGKPVRDGNWGIPRNRNACSEDNSSNEYGDEKTSLIGKHKIQIVLFVVVNHFTINLCLGQALLFRLNCKPNI